MPQFGKEIFKMTEQSRRNATDDRCWGRCAMSVFNQYQENLLSLFVKAYFHFEKCEKLQAVLVYFVIFNFDGDSLDQGVKTF